jgi:MOSC domain-containing protein YiiM
MSTLDLFSPSPPLTSAGRVVSIHRSNGGVPKLAVPAARITVAGVEGDRQRNLRHHGGPDRALCLYSLELIEALRAEGHPVEPGSMGENLVIAGVDWRQMVPGVRLRLGDVEIELTSFAHPCRNIRGSFLGGRIGRVSPETHPGWSRVYARVVSEGKLAPGDVILMP